MTAPALPGLTVTAEQPPPEETPLRTDVAGLIGRTRRGPRLEPVRVAGWRGFARAFGGLLRDAQTPYSARGYFDNGGEVAHVVRVVGAGTPTASAELRLGTLDAAGKWAPGTPAGANFASTAYTVEATSPGAWASGTRVVVRFRATGVTGGPEVDVRVEAPGEEVERFVRVPARDLPAALERSLYVRFEPTGSEVPATAATPHGPRSETWSVTLPAVADEAPAEEDYRQAARLLDDVAEVALIAAPDIHDDLGDPSELIGAMLEASAAARDRMVLLDVPAASESAVAAGRWIDALRDDREPVFRRCAAAYHPRLRVRDPLGGVARPVRAVPASGHVAGVISRLDRERGAYYSPANASIYDAVDTEASFSQPEQAALNAAGVNVLRCAAGGGLEVWGARTLDLDPDGRFVAHRRLIHRLVRAIRRVAEPLVFEVHGPELRLTFVRTITTVLLQAYNAGALKGERPDDAFRVQCDDRNNPPEEVDSGLLVCDIDIAPAVPMEFIRIRLALDPGGLLEVVEES